MNTVISPKLGATKHAATLVWLMLKIALLALFATSHGVVPVYQGF